MTDFPMFRARTGTGTRALATVRRVAAFVAGRFAARAARRALRLPLTHLSDAQLRDIGLRRCGDQLRDRV